MSIKNHETYADITAELRTLSQSLKYSQSSKYCELQPTVSRKPISFYFAEISDRIEAAWKREKAEIETDALSVGGLVEAERQRVVVSKTETATVGNAAAMRNALVAIKGMFRDIDLRCDTMEGEAYRVATAALSAPPRNCDVGTAEKQHCRFIEYCNACDCPMGCIHRKQFIGMLDTRCASMLKCYIRWAQMPYEADKKGEVDDTNG